MKENELETRYIESIFGKFIQISKHEDRLKNKPNINHIRHK